MSNSSANIVGQFASEDTIKKYVQNQGKTYTKIYSRFVSIYVSPK